MDQPSIQQAMQRAVEHHRAGRLSEAEAIYRDVLTAQPHHPDALYLLGLIAWETDQAPAAADLLRRAVALDPANPQYGVALGHALSRAGRVQESADAYASVLNRYPDRVDARLALAHTLYNLARPDAAIESLRQGLALCPESAELHACLGVSLTMAGLPAAAQAEHEQALRLRPGVAQYHTDLGSALLARGRPRDAITAHRQALSLRPDSQPAQSSFLYALHFDPDLNPPTIATEHADWGRSHAATLPPPRPHENDRSSDRRLRVGYVSGDLYDHPVAHFLLPLLEHRDREGFEIICYSNSVRSDEVTARLRGHADRWELIAGLSDDQAADRVRADRIDLLVDLSGHTGRNRLAVFARRPTPLQATYLGYPHSTGLTAIDYRLTDAVADPPGDADVLSTERLVRLPHGFLCYTLPSDLPPLTEASVGDHPLTFGSLNRIAKVLPRSIELWAEVLRAVPGSRLLIKTAALADPPVREQVLETLSDAGVAADRIDLAAATASRREHLETYHRIDIALDTFPYNGTMTTLEALAMGVPVITLAGPSHVSRVGASILTHAGLSDWIAATPQRFVELATALARRGPRAAADRSSLRDRLRASPVCDARGFTAVLEQAYRSMWESFTAARI
jgi:predicted O-linked N-acetylglucosamine transferase (SPINDLY family)